MCAHQRGTAGGRWNVGPGARLATAGYVCHRPDKCNGDSPEGWPPQCTLSVCDGQTWHPHHADLESDCALLGLSSVGFDANPLIGISEMAQHAPQLLVCLVHAWMRLHHKPRSFSDHGPPGPISHRSCSWALIHCCAFRFYHDPEDGTACAKVDCDCTHICIPSWHQMWMASLQVEQPCMHSHLSGCGKRQADGTHLM